MKRLLSILLLAAMLLTIAPCAASAEGAVGLTVSTAEALPGETVELIVELTGNPGINSMQFTAEYDTQRLELKEITPDAFLSTSSVLPNPETGTVVIWNPSNISGTGMLVTLSFLVKEDAEPGLAEVKLADVMAIDENEADLELEIIPGGVTVKEGEAPQLVTAHFASLTLDGTIGINYLVSMTDSVLANENARAVFVYKEKEYPRVIQGMVPDERNYYTFTFYIPAAEFANTVSLKFMDGEEVIPFEYDGKRLTNDTMKYSGQRYSKALSADSPARPLIDMLHNYCYNAYLGLEKKEPDVLPSTIATNPDISTVVAADMKPYKNSLTGSVTGLTVAAISLNLESTTEINLRFTPDEGRSIEEFRFEVNGRKVTPVPAGKDYMLTIENIAAKDLDTMYTVKVSSGSEEMEIQTSALAYCYTVLKKGLLSTDMQNTCKALYLYNQAANDYFHG